MANYIVQDTSLAAVADAIRAKTGGGEALAFPAGFVEAVEGIKAGGGEGLSFSAGAAGEVKVTPKGTATTIVNLTNLVVTTSATQS